MKINTFFNEINITYENCMKQPKPMFEIKLNEILARKPHLTNVLDRGVKHPLIRNHFHIPFNK